MPPPHDTRPRSPAHTDVMGEEAEIDHTVDGTFRCVEKEKVGRRCANLGVALGAAGHEGIGPQRQLKSPVPPHKQCHRQQPVAS